MQIKRLHKNIYKLYPTALSQDKREQRQKKMPTAVKNWEKLKAEGVSNQTCQEVTGISRATYYRRKKRLCFLSKRPKSFRKPRWGESEKQKILQIRRENPTYGKAKITVILKRDHGLILSEATVGRILRCLMDKGLVEKSISAPKQRRKRRFHKGHAKAWVYGMKPRKPGEMVQIDHMSVSKNQVYGKQFQAWDPLSKYIHAGLYSNATSTTAKRFLMDLIEKAPFPISSIQVDGGSEFMKEFEQACQELDIALFVLPPRRPQYNGGVERGNRIFKEEFYAHPGLLADSIGSLRQALSCALLKYNSYRPHLSLKGLTPFQYLDSIKEAA